VNRKEKILALCELDNIPHCSTNDLPRNRLVTKVEDTRKRKKDLSKIIQALCEENEMLRSALEFYGSGEIYDDLEIRPEKRELWNIPEKWALRSMSDHWPGKRARQALSAPSPLDELINETKGE